MRIKLTICLLLCVVAGWSQVNMSTTASYTQSFDTLTVGGANSWTNNLTIKNWYAKKLVGVTQTNITAYVIDNGGGNASNLYSYGTTAGATDRALGGLTVDAQPNYAYGMLLRNTSGNPITNLTVAYTGEQWRDANTVAQDLIFSYKISTAAISDLTPGVTSGWVVVPALKFTSKRNGNIGLLNGNDAANRTVIPAVTIPSLNLANNSYIMIKWEKSDVSSGSNHPMAIDDLTVAWTATPLCTGVTITSVTPTAAPVGTEVTINAASGLVGATATFNGVAATVVSSSATKLVVIVPVGASAGNLIVTNAAACAGTPLHYDIIKSDMSSCLGSTLQTNLFISEVTDSNYGALTYVELFNNTGSSVALSNYSIKVAFNGNAYSSTYTFPTGANILNGATYVVAFRGTDICSIPGGNGSYANDISYVNAGINFETGKHDHIGLFNSAGTTLIDAWGVVGSGSWSSGTTGNNGASFKRKNTATLPSTVYSNADWNIVDFASNVCANNDYTDIGHYEVLRAAPTVDTSPSAAISCLTKNITLHVAGTEGFAGPPGLAFKWYVAAPGAMSFTAITDNTVYSGSDTMDLTITGIAALYDYQYYCQIRENSVTCYTASNAYVIKDLPTVTWTGSWIPSMPTNAKRAIIKSTYSTLSNGNLEVCSCEIATTGVLNIGANSYAEIQGNIINAGTINIANNGSLIQVDNTATVNGVSNVIRTTSFYDPFDYTYWSAPVFEPTIGASFPDMRTDHAYSFNTANFADLNNDNFDDAAPFAWTSEGPLSKMKPGVGYIVRASSAPGVWPRQSNGTFGGIINNGIINVAASLSGNNADNNDDFNLVGNPYPSAISANTFIDVNTNTSGTLYFWTHVDNISPTNPGPDMNNYSSDDYAVYNKIGGTRTAILHPGHPVSGIASAPSGFIASGQGFFTDYNGPGPIVFNNDMRNKDYANANFFKQAEESKIDRIWLNLSNADNMFSQQLIGYVDDATIGYDRGYDGLLNNAGTYVNFYSLIGTDYYKIQGRPAFDESDIVPLGYFSSVAGTFEMALDKYEGTFDTVENIYLEDKELHVLHDLKQAPYSFATESGTFNNRFVLKYTNETLGVNHPEGNRNQIDVAVDKKIEVRSIDQPIQSVTVYDLLGRTIFSTNNVNAREFVVDGLSAKQQSLIIRIVLQNGIAVSKKMVY